MPESFASFSFFFTTDRSKPSRAMLTKKKKSRLDEFKKNKRRTAVTSPRSPPPPPIVPEEEAAGGGGDATAEEAITASAPRRVLRGSSGDNDAAAAAAADKGDTADAADDSGDAAAAAAVAFQASATGRLAGEPPGDDIALDMEPCDVARRIAEGGFVRELMEKKEGGKNGRSKKKKKGKSREFQENKVREREREREGATKKRREKKKLQPRPRTSKKGKKEEMPAATPTSPPLSLSPPPNSSPILFWGRKNARAIALLLQKGHVFFFKLKNSEAKLLVALGENEFLEKSVSEFKIFWTRREGREWKQCECACIKRRTRRRREFQRAPCYPRENPLFCRRTKKKPEGEKSGAKGEGEEMIWKQMLCVGKSLLAPCPPEPCAPVRLKRRGQHELLLLRFGGTGGRKKVGGCQKKIRSCQKKSSAKCLKKVPRIKNLLPAPPLPSPPQFSRASLSSKEGQATEKNRGEGWGELELRIARGKRKLFF